MFLQELPKPYSSRASRLAFGRPSRPSRLHNGLPSPLARTTRRHGGVGHPVSCGVAARGDVVELAFASYLARLSVFFVSPIQKSFRL